MNKQTHPEYANQVLLRFIPALKDGDSSFISEFCTEGGLNALIKLTQFGGSSKKDIRRSFLDIIYALLNAPNDIGFEQVTEHSHLIQAIVNTFESNLESIKTRCIQILCILCWWRKESYEKVCNGMYHFCSFTSFSFVFVVLRFVLFRNVFFFHFCSKQNVHAFE